jgi:hypothetical protein
VAQAVGNQRAEDQGDTVGRVPQIVAQRLFTAHPPARHDNHHGGRNGRFKRAEDETEDEQGDKALAGGHDQARGRPADKAENDPVVDLEPDEGVYRQGLKDELGNVDDGGEPAVFLALEVGIFTEGKYGGLSS